MWRNYYSDSSSAFLWNEIHNQINKQYLDKTQKQLANKEQAEAIQLSNYLQDIKKYASGLQTANYFQETEWELFLEILNSIEGRNGRFLNKLFRVPDTGAKRQHRFQQDLTAVIRSIQKTLGQLNIGSFDGGKIQLGQATTNVTINQELFADKIGQKVMEVFKVRTQRHFQTTGKTGKGLNPVSVKVDVAGGNTTITQQAIYDKNKIVPNFNRFATLMLSASFSAKNYSNRRSGVGLEKTQMLRVLLDFLPQLNTTVANDEALFSFIYALSHRIEGNVKKSSSYDVNINQVLGELDFIYRLTGRGQSYDTDSIQLNNYLQQGAKYLIYNQHNSSNIWVASTRYLIYKKMESLKQNQQLRWGHSMSISKGLISGKA